PCTTGRGIDVSMCESGAAGRATMMLKDRRDRVLGNPRRPPPLARFQDTRGRGGGGVLLFLLGVIHRLLGDLDEAERLARRALALRERLDLPDVPRPPHLRRPRGWRIRSESVAE